MTIGFSSATPSEKILLDKYSHADSYQTVKRKLHTLYPVYYRLSITQKNSIRLYEVIDQPANHVSRLTTLGKPCVTGSTKKVYAGDRTRDLAVPRSTATPTWLPLRVSKADFEFTKGRSEKVFRWEK
ncbi:hypothetical protein RND71_023000 [Anisodus tanguticus]|uniref:Uncharacterized protein n=1 Tax=Anisodus tanguticus TaxID=243964 RepID=A0AAE1RTL2_9SOLA|nr:hypothetical protein RND71_023000 [Anisodus tanguticus]